MIKGEMTLTDIRQALFEKLSAAEEDYAIRYSRGATLYINPTNGFGDEVVPRNTAGHKINNIYSDRPYRSAADEFKI